jgi:hypothetical protein
MLKMRRRRRRRRRKRRMRRRMRNQKLLEELIAYFPVNYMDRKEKNKAGTQKQKDIVISVKITRDIYADGHTQTDVQRAK